MIFLWDRTWYNYHKLAIWYVLTVFLACVCSSETWRVVFLGLMAIKCVSTTFNNHLYGMIMDQAPKVWISWDLVKTMGWSYEIGNVSYEFSLDSHDFDQGGGLLSLLRQNWSVYLVGGWAQPLWKIWVRQMGVGNSQYDRKVIKFMFQSPPTSNMAIKHARLSQGQSGEIHWPMA